MPTESIHNVLRTIASPATVHIVPLDLKEPFIDLAARFAHLPGTVLLQSGGDPGCARFHILGIWPWLQLSARHDQVCLTVDECRTTIQARPLLFLQAMLRKLHLPPGNWPLPIAAGLLGYLAYDLKDDVEVLPHTSIDDLQLPHMLLYAPSLLLIHDRRDGSSRIAIPLRPGADCTAEQLLRRFHAVLAKNHAPGSYRLPSNAPLANFKRPEYEAAVRRVIAYITSGDVYQVNLSQRFQVPFEGDAFALFKRLFELNPAPFFAFIQAGDHQIASTSPERFLLQNGRRLETRPIKGTRPRGRTAAEDEALRTELAASTKDDAELSMIVDLLRNDLGKVCQADSVKVTAHKRIEAYRNVYHLVSTIEGVMEENINSADVIEAAFPGGSITGCPKVRAMEIIDELEPCRRHVYCGSIGYISFHDSMDLSIAIRTATIINDTLIFSVGGGIVFDSDPGSEYEETLHKAETLLTACRDGSTQRRPEGVVWLDGRLRPTDQAAVAVTDQGILYGHGFFETIRVDRGRAPLLDAHASRFEKSWRTLMPSEPPDLSWQTIIAQVVQANHLQDACAAVKILATRGSRDLAPWDHTLLVTARPYSHRLAGGKQGLRLATYPQAHQSPLADHKTLNYLYFLLAGQWARARGCDEALVLNPDGSVSQTNTANLLLRIGDMFVRPVSPAVLPGVMSAAVCQELQRLGFEIQERLVEPAELLSAAQVLATNALMGAVPVVAVDGAARAQGDDLWRRINDIVIPGWQTADAPAIIG